MDTFLGNFWEISDGLLNVEAMHSRTPHTSNAAMPVAGPQVLNGQADVSLPVKGEATVKKNVEVDRLTIDLHLSTQFNATIHHEFCIRFTWIRFGGCFFCHDLPEFHHQQAMYAYMYASTI